MSCYIVPLVEAAVVSVCRKAGVKSGFIGRHLASLELMLWGGSVMLIVDHIINGELTWRFPFFTALGTSGGGVVVLREILTVGVPMCVIITLVWAVWAYYKEHRAVYSQF